MDKPFVLLVISKRKIKTLSNLPKFVLQEGFRYNGAAIQSIKYTADFQYLDIKRNITIIEELKSSYTAKLADYRIRARLFQYQIKKKHQYIKMELNI